MESDNGTAGRDVHSTACDTPTAARCTQVHYLRAQKCGGKVDTAVSVDQALTSISVIIVTPLTALSIAGHPGECVPFLVAQALQQENWIVPGTRRKAFRHPGLFSHSEAFFPQITPLDSGGKRLCVICDLDAEGHRTRVSSVHVVRLSV